MKNQAGGKYTPMILVVLDGWGIAAPNEGNAVTLAGAPNFNRLWSEYPSSTLCASGDCVGLPSGQVGNSEAGHMNIGAGRIAKQDAVRINDSIEDGTFNKNTGFLEAIKRVKKNKSNLHIMGLLSGDSSPHCDPLHIIALVKFARSHGVSRIFLHIFTDGRDSPRYASLKLVEDLNRKLTENGCVCGEEGPGFIGTIMGRFFAMDRKKEWPRTEQAYNALVMGEGRTAPSAQAAITEAYNRGESDEFIEPYIITAKGQPLPRIDDGDSVIFWNLRSDRARQLAKVFVQEDFVQHNPGSFSRKKYLKDLCFVAMTDFGPDLDSIITAFPSVDLKDTLPMQLKDLRQLYIAETEKYAHVTYFINGGYIDSVGGEERICIPSPDVISYDETPAMSTELLTNMVIDNLKNNLYDFTMLNIAAPDMIGHTGNLKAAIKCCKAVDGFLGRIVDAYLGANGTVIITADHGNIEKMINLETGELYTEHTSNPVPFIIASNSLKDDKIELSDGVLADIAPTLLDLLGKPQPPEMSGSSLIIKDKKA